MRPHAHCQYVCSAQPNADSSGVAEKESGFESSPGSPREYRCDECQPPSSAACGACAESVIGTRANSSRVSLSSFKFIKKLGSGGYGRVLLVQKRRGPDRGCLYAMKVMRLSRAALVERDIMPRLHSLTYTTQLAYAFFDATRAKAFLVMSYCAGKDLFSLSGASRVAGYLRRMFTHNYPRYVHRVRIILAELSVALAGLHQRGILYRDLKLENILVHGDGHIRLADFGLSRCLQPGEPVVISGKTGTPDYMAPEVIRSSGTRGPATRYGYEADMWGLGVVAYELIVGQLPFKGREVPDLEEAILHEPLQLPGDYVTYKINPLSQTDRPLVLAALSLVNALLQRDPRRRPRAADLADHVFFRDLDWARLTSGVHDDAPFDVARILAENPDVSDSQRNVSPFAETTAAAANQNTATEVTNVNGYDNPSRYQHYHYERGGHGWRASHQSRHVGDNSWLDLPSPTTAANEVCDDTDTGSSTGGCQLIRLPGLAAFEAAAAAVSDSSFEEEEWSVQPEQQPKTTSTAKRTRTAAFEASSGISSASMSSSDDCCIVAELPPKKRRRFRRVSGVTLADDSGACGGVTGGGVTAGVMGGVCSPLPPFSSLRSTRSTRLTAR